MNKYSSKKEDNVSRQLMNWSLLIGLVALTIAACGLFYGVHRDDSRPVFSWLIGFTVWFSISVGMLFSLMIWHVFDAGWSVIIRRQLEHAVGAFPWLALIFLPLLFITWFGKNPGILWDWMNPNLIAVGAHETVGHDPVYLHKAGYLNIPFFTLRVIGYFLIYWFFTYKLRSNSYAMDFDSNLKYVRANRVYAAIGLPVIALVTTFAAFDFYMSLSYEWFSTMYAVWFFATSMRGGHTVTVLICALLATRGYLKGVFNRAHLYLFGCLLLAFTVFWAYITFCQYFLIYNANVPEETFWFNMRELNADGGKSSWWWLSLLGLIFGYFLIPFIILLFYKTKVIMRRMVLLSCWILVFFLCDIYFNILPYKVEADNPLGYTIMPFSISLWDIAAIVGIGGIWIWSFLRSMNKAEPIPIHDPRIEESLHAYE